MTCAPVSSIVSDGRSLETIQFGSATDELVRSKNGKSGGLPLLGLVACRGLHCSVELLIAVNEMRDCGKFWPIFQRRGYLGVFRHF